MNDHTLFGEWRAILLLINPPAFLFHWEGVAIVTDFIYSGIIMPSSSSSSHHILNVKGPAGAVALSATIYGGR
jgi:hypothetical protein